MIVRLAAVAGFVIVAGVMQAAPKQGAITPLDRASQLPSDAPRAGLSSLLGTISGNDGIDRAFRIGLSTIGGRRVAETQSARDGTFAFRNVSPGLYAVAVIGDGYDVELGRTLLRINRAERASFRKGVVLRGRVVDERRVAAAGVNVCALVRETSDGRDRFVHAVHTTTSARGEYEMHNSERLSGTYVVAAMPAGCTLQANAADVPLRFAAYPPAFHPRGVRAEDATTITTDAAHDRNDLNIDMARGLVTTLMGRLHGYINDTIVPGRVVLEPPGDGLVSIVRTTKVAADGSFSFAGLIPGTYRVIAPPLTSAITPFTWADSTVDIDGQRVRQFAMTLRPAMAIGGTVSFEGHDAPLLGVRTFSAVTARLVSERADTRVQLPSPFVSVDARGRFAISGLMPGAYRLSIAGYQPLGWEPLSATAPASPDQPPPLDLLDVPMTIAPGRSVFGVQIVMTRSLGGVTGTVVDAAGNAVPDATVIVFATVPEYWGPGTRRVSAARTNSAGTFTVEGLPNGEYFAAAVASRPRVLSPETLATLREGARRVDVPLGPPVHVMVRLNTGTGTNVTVR